jgi:NAD(P)-dependent dehydrogenase (short-subunit alcohol dehydrogenase family)
LRPKAPAVVLGDIEADALARVTAGIASKGGKAETVTGDRTEEAGATRLIDGANAKHGRIGILVNNLGRSRNAKIWEMAVADFDFVLRLNLRSTFLVSRGVAPAHDEAPAEPHHLPVVGGQRRHAVGPPATRAEPPTRWRRPVCTGHPRRGAGARRVQHYRQRHGTRPH